jgi:NAD(P)H-nitrite reductase large subunit
MPEGQPAHGAEVETSGFEGEPVGTGRVVAIRSAPWQDRRRLLVLEVPSSDAEKVAGIRLFKAERPEVAESLTPTEGDDAIVCRCERVTRGEIVRYIRDNGIADFNALKAGLRVGMGPCGGKTCTELVMRIFRQVLGNGAEAEPHTERPFVQEVPLSSFLEDGR